MPVSYANTGATASVAPSFFYKTRPPDRLGGQKGGGTTTRDRLAAMGLLPPLLEVDTRPLKIDLPQALETFAALDELRYLSGF